MKLSVTFILSTLIPFAAGQCAEEDFCFGREVTNPTGEITAGSETVTCKYLIDNLTSDILSTSVCPLLVQAEDLCCPEIGCEDEDFCADGVTTTKTVTFDDGTLTCQEVKDALPTIPKATCDILHQAEPTCCPAPGSPTSAPATTCRVNVNTNNCGPLLEANKADIPADCDCINFGNGKFVSCCAFGGACSVDGSVFSGGAGAAGCTMTGATPTAAPAGGTTGGTKSGASAVSSIFAIAFAAMAAFLA